MPGIKMPGGAIMRLRHATKYHRIQMFFKRIISQIQKVKMEFYPARGNELHSLAGLRLQQILILTLNRQEPTTASGSYS
ncbi:MAG: hypothetical protein Q8J90_01430 [Gallionella sp.]|jgi:hypothetical protein|nr:hypothetical protein [Gallionella sp.]